MTTIYTHDVFKEFIAVGFTEPQAEALIYALYTRPLPVNTLDIFRKLMAAGFTELQAELIANTCFTYKVK